MQLWQRVFRTGVVPTLSTISLEALRHGLETDDRAILQNATTFPPPLQCLADQLVEAACPLAYALWKGDQLSTVGEVEQAFAWLCQRASVGVGEPNGVRYLLNWIDDVERATMRRELLAEVCLALEERQPQESAA